VDDRSILDAINPNSHIPVLDDKGLIIWESMAINLYLGDRYGHALWPNRIEDRAATYQWSLWAQSEFDRTDWNRARRSGDEKQIHSDRRDLIKALAVLDRALQGREYILGDDFSLVDLNVATTLSEPHEKKLIRWQRVDPLEAGAALAAWLRRCTGRPSYSRVLVLP
jgi:glutathione S-transferase